MASNIPSPQQWWQPWQWIFALIIAPVISSYLTTEINNIRSQTKAGDTQKEIWLSEADVSCYAKNYGHLAQSITKGFTISSLTCPTGNTFITIKSPDHQVSTKWFGLTDVISNDILVDKYRLNRVLAQSPTSNVDYLITQNNKQNVVICSQVNNNIMTLVIRTPDGKCIKQKINIQTGVQIENREVSCESASCD